MDRGWHSMTCSSLERPRLGQQPYDRGRAGRACYNCGRDGHIHRNCPDLDNNRYIDPGRFSDRPSAGANGRWGHDPWAPPRIASSGGKESGNSRTDSVRQSSSSRRSHLDHYENGDLSSLRPRDNGDRYRNDEGRGYGAGTGSNASVRERDNVKDRDYVRDRDSSKTARSGSRKPADDNHRATGNHRGEERRDSKSKDAGESRSGKPVANGDVGGPSPSQHPSTVGGGGDLLRVKKDSKEDRPISKLSASEGDLGPNANIASVESALTNGNVAHQIIAASDIELGASAPADKESCQLNALGGDRDVECTIRSRASSSKRLPIAKLPLSVLCKDAAEGNLEKNYQQDQSAASSSSLEKSSALLDPIPVLSGQGNDGEERIVKEPISSSGQAKAVDGEGIVTEPILSSSGLSKDGEKEVIVVEPIPSSLGQSKDEEGIVPELIISTSGESKDGEEAPVVEPVLSSSCQSKDGRDLIEEDGRVDMELATPSPRVDEECTVHVQNCEKSTAPDHRREVEGEGTKEKGRGGSPSKEKGSGEQRLAAQLAQQPDAPTVCSCDGTEVVKAKRVSGWDYNAETRDSDKDAHLSRRGEVKAPVANGAEVSERIRPSGAPEQNNAWSHVRGVDERTPSKDTLDLDRVRHNPYHAEDRVSGRRSFGERDSDEPEWHRRRPERDGRHRESGSGSYFGRGGTNPEQSGGMGIEGVSARGSFRDHAEDMNYSCSGTPVRERHRSGDRDYSVDRHHGWGGGSREGSVDRAVADRNGYRNGRAGVKAEYWLSDSSADTPDFQLGDNGGVNYRWGGFDWRQSRVVWEAHPGHSQYRPRSYLTICNARFNRLERRSPPPALSPRSCHAVVPLDPPIVSPPRYVEEGYDAIYNAITSQAQDNDLVHYEAHGSVHQPQQLVYSLEKGLEDCPQLNSDRVVHREGSSHDQVMLGDGRSPHDSSIASRPLETQSQFVLGPSPRPSEVSPQPATPSGSRVLSPLEQTGKIENADKDICPPGTEAHGAASLDNEDHEDFHIDDRVESLMDGRVLIPGKEKEIVHEALSIASQRVRQEYESDIPIEESPRSHGGFADIDFGSDVQGLEGLGCDLQVTKVDRKAEEAKVGPGSERGAEVASVPMAAPRASSGTAVVPHRSESRKYHGIGHHEAWKWPSRGGDWKLVFVPESAQHVKGETAQGIAEKGYPGYYKKLVMNGGVTLCESKSNRTLRDPRRQNFESGRATVAEAMKLPLPRFVHRPLLIKGEQSAEDHHANHAQHSMTPKKGAITPRSQGSTPRAHLATPVKDRQLSAGPAAGFKVNKSGKGNSTPGSITGTPIKPLGQGKQQQQQPLNKGSKVGHPAVKRESSNNVKNGSSAIDKRGTPRSVTSTFDGQLQSSSADHVADTLDRKSKPSLPDGALETPSRTPRVPQASDLELKSDSATPLKKKFLSRSLLKEGLDVERHDAGTKLNKTVVLVAAKETPGKCAEAKELSIVTTLAVPVSPALSVLTPAALNGVPSTMAHLSVTTDIHSSKVVIVEHTPKHEKRLLDVHSTDQARGSVYGAPCENGAKMMDVEVEVCDRFTSLAQDVNFGEGGVIRSKRKASFVEDVESFRQRQRSMQKKRIVRSEDGAVDRKPSHSSPMPDRHTSFPLIGGPGKRSEADPMEGQNQSDEQPNWSDLKSYLLLKIFRNLRGDLMSLVTAMATCKAWFAAGQKYKTMLKRADLSSFHGHCLDAVLESLPGFGAGNLQSIVLKGCNVSPQSLSHLLRACPSISAVEIGYDEQFKELTYNFPNVRWLGDQNWGQSPKEGLSGKREKHFKTRSLNVIGVSRHRVRDSSIRDGGDGGEAEMHPVCDGASKGRSPNGYACLVGNVTMEETEMNEPYLDTAVTQFTHAASDGVKVLKLNNGGTIVKSHGINGSMKAVKQENGNHVTRLEERKRKAPSGSLRRKQDKASHRHLKPAMGIQRALAHKHFSSNRRVEHQSKAMISSLSEGDKTLEKEMRVILRGIMEADVTKYFHSANSLPTDGKSVNPVSKGPDLLAIERKLKGGDYAGGEKGFKDFKDDLLCCVRVGFRHKNDTLIFSTAEKLFKLAHKQFELLDSQISGNLPADSSNQGKPPCSRPSSKARQGGLKNQSIVPHHPGGKKRKGWDDDAAQKGRFGMAKKGRQGESSSGDVDSGSDSTEHETRKVPKVKKIEKSWESEGESSEEDEDTAFADEDEEETETEASDSDVPSESEGEDGFFEDESFDTDEDTQVGFHDWGARMTKAAMVPPVTRKYNVTEEYIIVADRKRVEEKMHVLLPEDYKEKLQAAKEKRVDSYSHLDIPETRDYQPRKELGEEVLEQEVYGIDPYTHNLLWDSMPTGDYSDALKQQFIEERLLLALNREAKHFTGSGKAPMEYSLERVVQRIIMIADADNDWGLKDFSEQLLENMRSRPKDKFVAYRKGLGVVCNKDKGLEKDEFVVEFFGEVYPPWRWYEKQDGIRSLQKKDKDTTPEFYNIFYERPKGDAAGYDLLVVDAMHKANFASRLCHSCRPNCEAKITAVNSTYIIGVYTLKPIKRGEELTFDYNSVTESKEEYNNAVCLCGSQGCRGSYLNLTGSGTFEEIILKQHGLLDRHRLLLDSCSATSVSEEGLREMQQAGLGSCLLSGLPPWVLKYAAGLVHFMNIEKALLPAELLKDLELKLKQGVMEGATEEHAEITTEGVYNQRLQNLAITLDKVRHILTKIYKNPSLAPPPLRKLDKREMVQWIWKRENSVVNELLQCVTPHLPKELMSDLKQSISKHVPNDLGTNLMESLLWLRDELRKLLSTCRARHDAAADLIHIYAHTKTFFVLEDYAVLESSPISIHPLDLGSSRHSISGPRSWHKTYSKEYVWGQLIGWYKQSVADPGASLVKAARGCLTLPDVSSCYAKSMQHDFKWAYGHRHREKMICHMEDKPQQKWPTSKFWSQSWSFKNERGLFGSPMLDSVLQDKPLDDQMLEWLKSRVDVFEGPYDGVVEGQRRCV